MIVGKGQQNRVPAGNAPQRDRQKDRPFCIWSQEFSLSLPCGRRKDMTFVGTLGKCQVAGERERTIAMSALKIEMTPM